MKVPGPPPSPVEPVTDYYHGTLVMDPYRWLEDQNSDRTRKWIAQQTSYTRAYLDALPGRDRIRDRVEQLLAAQTYREPRKTRDRCFFLKREELSEQFVLAMREGESDEDIVLFDPVRTTGSPNAAIDILAVSRNGKFVALAERTRGEDSAPIAILDVETRQLLSDRLPAGICGGLVFAEDRRGFYYVRRDASSPQPCNQALCWHELGTALEDDPEIAPFPGGPEALFTIGAVGPSSCFLYRAFRTAEPACSDFYIHDPVQSNSVRILLKDIRFSLLPFFIGSDLFAWTDFNAPNGRIVKIDLRQPDPAQWITQIPECRMRIQQCAVVDDFICLLYLDNLTHKLRVFDRNGNSCAFRPDMGEGSVRLLGHHLEQADTLFYQFSSFGRPPVIFSYRPVAREHGVWPAAGESCSNSPIEVRRVRYPAKDGTFIPMFLAGRRGLENSGPAPVFLTAYGGFGNTITPRFNAYSTVLMEMGCVFAVANLRGGGEFGKAWHEAAKRRNRQTAIDDFIAAAEWLCENGIADPGRIAIGGGSNAGLLVGAALTQRPDLFRAVLCLGPLLDMLRYHRFDQAKNWIGEYGCSDDADDFRALRSYSPYHRIRHGVEYPAVMFISGDADTRCNPMHTRKMAARLQTCTRSNHPILLDYKPNWGHVSIQPFTSRVNALTDRLAFLATELGLAVPEVL